MKRLLLLTALILLIQVETSATSEPRSTPPDAQERIIDGIERTVTSLKSIRTDNRETSVPPDAIPLLTGLKHQLLDLVQNTLDASDCTDEGVAGVQTAILNVLKQRKIIDPGPQGDRAGVGYVDDSFTYGGILSIEVQRIPRHDDLVAATTTLQICCGEDTSFYLFRREGNRQRLIMAQESNDYEEVSGGHGSFKYAVSPPSDTGGFFVVTAYVNPWCSSNWQGIRYRVLREGVAAHQPRIIFENKESIYLGDEDHGALSLQPNGFRIDFDAMQSLDFGVLIRKHVAAYRVEDDRVWRVPPVAMEPEGFLDEWFDMPPGEAERWIRSPDSESLLRWRQMLHESRDAMDLRFLTAFVFDPPACELTAGTWQIGIQFSALVEKESLPDGIPQELYFTVEERDGAYFLTDAYCSPRAPKCGSPTLSALPSDVMSY